MGVVTSCASSPALAGCCAQRADLAPAIKKITGQREAECGIKSELHALHGEALKIKMGHQKHPLQDGCKPHEVGINLTPQGAVGVEWTHTYKPHSTMCDKYSIGIIMLCLLCYGYYEYNNIFY